MDDATLAAIRERDAEWAFAPDGVVYVVGDGEDMVRVVVDRHTLLAEVDRLRALMSPVWRHVKEPAVPHDPVPHHTGQGSTWWQCSWRPDPRELPCGLSVRPEVAA